MKKLLSVIFLLQLVTNVFGQNSDSTITANAYIGVLNQNEYKVDGANKHTSANLRVGGVVYWKIAPSVTYTSFGVIQISPTEVYGLQVHFVEYRTNKNLTLKVGYMPTLVTEQRPFPVSSGGQFETWTQSQIPGATFGLKANYSSGKLGIGSGVAIRNSKLEYGINLRYKSLTIAGYYNDVKRGFAATYNKKRLYSILVYNEVIVANTTVFKIVPKFSISLWSDLGYNHVSSKLVRYEGGVFKSFELKKVNGLFSFGYDVISKSITGYIFVYKFF